MVVRNLTNAAHHNGKDGVVQAFEIRTGRYICQLADGSTLSLRPGMVLPSIGVTVIDVQERGDLNGRVGRIVGEIDGRYKVNVVGNVVALKPANCLLPRGTRVIIEGLTNTAHWNGHVGAIHDVDLEAKRYVVDVSDQQQLRIRWDNVRL